VRAALVDTDVASVLYSPANQRYDAVASIVAARFLLISFMTGAELLYWPKANSWGTERAAKLEANIERYITLYPDEKSCEVRVGIKLQSKRKARPIATADAWIAATAIRYQIPLITLNHRDFNFIDDLELIPVSNPSPNA